MNLPFPRIEELSFEWTLYLVVGAMISWRLRHVVFQTQPSKPLIGLDWGILLGSVIYYAPMIYNSIKGLVA